VASPTEPTDIDSDGIHVPVDEARRCTPPQPPRPFLAQAVPPGDDRARSRARLGGSDDQLDTKTGWLSRDELESIRANVPLVYVDAVPVRVDEAGRVTKVGMLLRQAADGTISRMVVSGRVLFGERVRDALMRHLEKDLGPVALPRIPSEVAPFTVVEYFPDPDVSGFHDPPPRSAWPSSCPWPVTAPPPRKPSTWPGTPPRKRSATMSATR
jgi:hypothetical protein